MLKVPFGLLFLSIGAAVGFSSVAQAQKPATGASGPALSTPLRADNWEFKPGNVEFLPAAPRIGSVSPQGPAMKIISRSGGAVVAKNTDFSEGIIEFDMLPTDSTFASFHFHRQDTSEFESIYLRTSYAAGHPEIMEGVQYTPTIKGVSCWNLMPHYQGNANFRMDTWSHFRIVISGRQMLVYLNSETRPTLAIPRLEGNSNHGPFAFEGQMTVAHLVVRPGPVKDIGWLSGPEGYDPTDNDPRCLRHWQVTGPAIIPPGIDFGKNLLPGKETSWSPIHAERRGLIDLTRAFGGNRQFNGEPPRRIIWLKTTLTADKDWNYRMRLGFTNDVWVFLNGKYLYVDKNYYDEPSMKSPRGRVSIENCSFELPLKAGANELLIGVGNQFFGWGIIARLDDNLGVKMEGADQ